MSDQIPFIAGKRVIIAGAGISGLSLAIALHKHLSSFYPSLPLPSITIYERSTLSEYTSEIRSGYSLTIRSDGVSAGLQTLRKLGLLNAGLAARVPGLEKGSPLLWDKDWNEILRPNIDKRDLPVAHMRISRRDLLGILKGALPRGVEIKWGVSCVGVENTGDHKTRVTLSDGSNLVSDLLVAADGAGSKLRRCLRPDDELDFAGVVILLAIAHFPDKKIPTPINRGWGLYLNGESESGCFASPIDEERVSWSISYRTTKPRETLSQPLSQEDQKILTEEILDRAITFKEPFFTLLNATDKSTIKVLNARDKQPFPHDSIKPNVVFIGDSNHGVSPFAGNGANLAMADAWDMAKHLCTCHTLDEALQKYDAVSVPRAKTVVATSRKVMWLAHSTGWKLWLVTVVLKIINRLKGM